VLSLLGDKALALALVYTLTGDALLWSFGIYILQRVPNSKIRWREVISPPAIAVVLSVLLAFAGLPRHLPEGFFTCLHYPALLTVPLGLFCAGGVYFHALRQVQLKDLPFRQIGYSTISRIIFLPCFWICIVLLTVPVSVARKIFFIEAVMPTSVVTVALVAIYGGNHRFAVLYAVLTNIISIVSVPLYMSFIMKFAGWD
jgi:predicted permease